MNFTYESYEALIALISNEGYEFSDYDNHAEYEKPCILRHDIDFDIGKAVELAIVEANIFRGGANPAIYFFQLSSDWYNLMSRQSMEGVYKILNTGSAIGLHFDECKYDITNAKDDYIERVEEEISMISKLLGVGIKVVSMHNPSKYTLESDFCFPSATNTYSALFFKDFKYLSDSKMIWKEDVFSIIKSGNYDRLHILTHPVWYDVCENSPERKLTNLMNSTIRKRRMELSAFYPKLNETTNMEESF